MGFMPPLFVFGGAASSFSPRDIAGLKLWLRSDLGVTTSGGLVTAQADQSQAGDPHHDVAAPGGSRPTFNATDDAYCGKPSFSTAGLCYLEGSAAWSPALSQPNTWYAVAKVASDTGGNGLLIASDSGASTNNQGVGIQISAWAAVSNTGGGNILTSDTVTTVPRYVCAVYNGASSALYLNDMVTASGTGNLGTDTVEFPAFGANVSGGAAGTGTDMIGSWTEILCYSGAHTQAQRQQVAAYLQGRYYDPTQFVQTGLWRSNFTGSPWSGTASAGPASGFASLSEITTPATTSAALNGRTGADFSGGKILSSSSQLSSFLGASTGSVFGMFLPRSTTADAGAANPFNNPCLFVDSGVGRFAVGYASLGMRAGYFDGSVWDSVVQPAATGSPHCFMFTYDGTTTTLYLDSLTPATLLRGSPSFFTTALTVGQSIAGTFLDAIIYELGASAACYTATDFTNYKRSVNNRFAITL